MAEILKLSEIQANLEEDPVEKFALDVLMGLSSTPKSIAPKYFYDDLGSRLFQKITETQEYYPTQCEAEILGKYSRDIATKIGSKDIKVIELGAGDGRKTKLLLPALMEQINLEYCPIDISEAAITGLIKSLRIELPKLQAKGIVSEYFSALRWLRDNHASRNLVLFLGSNIGNFNPAQSQVFLRTVWNALNPGDLVLLGCDLKKNIDIMLHAYNDQGGYTRQFNLNLLTRMNRELGANFDLEHFDHFGTYNVKLGAMESFLLSTRKQQVHVKTLNKSFDFLAYEPIHVEFSFKYLPEEIEQMASQTGYQVLAQYYDKRGFFSDSLLVVDK